MRHADRTIHFNQGFQQPLIAIQTILPNEQVAEGTALIMFIQALGGTISISVAQNVFNNKLIKNVLEQRIPVDPATLLTHGATELTNTVDPKYIGQLRVAYNKSLTQVSRRPVRVRNERCADLKRLFMSVLQLPD